MTDPLTDPPSAGPWRKARVLGRRAETPTAVTLALGLDEPLRHRPGQHVVVRLTAPDGYQAQRSYSIASPPGDDFDPTIDLTIERLADGEVSPFLHDVVEPGDELEVRGPIGGWFVWDGGAPAVLVGGGSGVVPLMAMLRHARRIGTARLVRLVVSVRSPADLYYADELPGPETTVIYTRSVPQGAARAAGRLGVADLGTIDGTATVYVCGSGRFADGASRVLLQAGVPAERIRVERFGPTA